MPFRILALSLLLFAGVFVLHVAVWRLFRVRREMLLLALLFLAVPGVALVVALVSGRLAPVETMATVLMLYALSVAYIQTYPGLKDDIPSFRILMLLDQAGRGGMTESEILDQIGEQSLFAFKVAELESDSLVIRNGDRVRLTPAGRMLATVFRSYRRLLGLGPGKG
ncbi:MAG: hypothetical protein EPN55_06960 [Gammaproteobacteria bacterium]|nr:MAG: hypothetical protein EPN55_06960 [Gammaproteobacteria bacterium]